MDFDSVVSLGSVIFAAIFKKYFTLFPLHTAQWSNQFTFDDNKKMRTPQIASCAKNVTKVIGIYVLFKCCPAIWRLTMEYHVCLQCKLSTDMCPNEQFMWVNEQMMCSEKGFWYDFEFENNVIAFCSYKNIISQIEMFTNSFKIKEAHIYHLEITNVLF